MASYFNLTLDTTAPSLGSISLPARSSSVNITAALSATDASYMKLWGDICATAGGSAISESDASWVAYNASASIILTATEGTKTVYAKFKDDVGNESSAVNASTILDTSVPIVTIIGPDVAKISKVSGYNVSAFSFSADDSFDEWTVRVVPSTDSLHDAGTQIPTTGGSTNMSGNTTTAASTAVECTIYGADLETASTGDGAKIIKVFVKDLTGNWSV
jgi:hypothetical protein